MIKIKNLKLNDIVYLPREKYIATYQISKEVYLEDAMFSDETPCQLVNVKLIIVKPNLEDYMSTAQIECLSKYDEYILFKTIEEAEEYQYKLLFADDSDISYFWDETETIYKL